MTSDWGPLDRLLARAEALAGAWGARATSSTTIGQERAILRLLGVTGLDPTGRPLAGAAVDRWLAGDPRALAAGIALPFAMALLEYDSEPQQMAIDVASGAVDLGLESELLREPDQRLLAQAEAARLGTAAIERIDAQRTVRLETIAMLGDAGRPWIGLSLNEPDIDAALEEAADLISAGVDLIRIQVPIGRELADRMIDAGLEVPDWHPTSSGPAADAEPVDPAPTGSQRALARLRSEIDRSAARRRAYVRIATAPPVLGAPEGAVVAAFERIDVIASDPMAEIVANAVEPERSLADHAFAHRLARRAGTTILVDSGPLVVAPDLAAGQPSDPVTRAGRALALQLLGVLLARGDGLPADQILVGAIPPWAIDEPSPASRSVAEVAIRRAVFPDHRLGFLEPPTGPQSPLWPHVQAAAAIHAGEVGLVLRTTDPHLGSARAIAGVARASATVTTDTLSATMPGALTGHALAHARGMVEVALATLDQLGNDGWRTVTGEPPAGVRGRSAIRDAAVERTESFDIFAGALGPQD